MCLTLLRDSIRDVEAELKTLTNNKTRGGRDDLTKKQIKLPKRHKKCAKLHKKRREIESEHVKPSRVDGTTTYNERGNVRGGLGYLDGAFLDCYFWCVKSVS